MDNEARVEAVLKKYGLSCPQNGERYSSAVEKLADAIEHLHRVLEDQAEYQRRLISAILRRDLTFDLQKVQWTDERVLRSLDEP